MKRCSKCGARNEDRALACSLCAHSFKAESARMESLEPRLMRDGKQTHRGEVALAKTEAVVPDPKKPVKEDTRTERHYLVLTFGDPLKLDPKVASYVMGRDPDSHVKLPSLKSSRRHAEVRWKDNRAVIRDLGSRNGTWVEGSRVEREHMLEDGETVRLGDALLTYRYLVPGEELRVTQGPAETMVDEPAAPTTLPTKGLEGLIVFLPISELLKRLAVLGVFGTITVEAAGGGEGTISVTGGRPVDGSYAGLEGAVAIQAMTSLNKGTFRFEPDPSWKPPPTTMRQAPQIPPSAPGP